MSYILREFFKEKELSHKNAEKKNKMYNYQFFLMKFQGKIFGNRLFMVVNFFHKYVPDFTLVVQKIIVNR